MTLPHLPYPAEASAPERVVEAVGKQYAWSLTEGATPTLANWDSAFSPVVTVPVGRLIEFRVTTLDATHGFSLYSPDGRLMAQTQAMPGYVNRPESGAMARTIVGSVAVGGYGFVMMFYVAGMYGVPRRYAAYPAEIANGPLFAWLSLAFIAVLLVGILAYVWEAGRRCVKALGA